MSKKAREMPSVKTILMAKSLNVLKNKKASAATVRTLRDAAAGKRVSDARLRRAQEFCLNLLEELNSKRPSGPRGCGGNRALPAFLL